METGEPRERREPLVDPRVVLHRAGAERVEARVHAEVAGRELGEVADELELRHLGQARRLGAAELFRNLRRRRQVLVVRERRRAPPRLRLLVDELHRATSASTSASRSISPGVRRSVTRDEQDVVHALVVAAERVAGVDTLLARVRDDLARVPSDADGKLLERCPIGKHRLESRPLREALLRVRGQRQAGLPQLAQPLRPEPREVDEPAEREQRLVRGDVRGGLLPPDVLLAGLQGEDIAALARGVYRLADDASRHAPDELLARREEAVVRTAEGREVPGSLSFAERERGAVAARRLEHAERQEVDVRDRQRAGFRGSGDEVRRRLEAAEEVRLLEDDGGGVRGRALELARVRRPVAVGNLDDLEAEPGRVGLHDLSHLRVRRLGHDDLVAPGRVLRDVAGVGGDDCAVVAGRVRDVHARELADRRLVLEDRLEHPLAHLRLVRRVRGQQLAALEDRVDDRRDVVVVHARSEEGQLAARVGVPPGKGGDVVEDLLLRQRGLEIELPPEADSLRQVAEELLDRADADRPEHLLPVGIREREERVRHWCASSSR